MHRRFSGNCLRPGQPSVSVLRKGCNCCARGCRGEGRPSVRRARIPDLEAIHKVATACGAKWTTGQLEAELAREIAVVLVAKLGPEVAGFAVGWHVADELQVLEVAVHPAFRRQGLGTQLMRELLQSGSGNGSNALLEVRASNAAAIAMYQQHLGFATVGRRRGYYADGEDALLMALPIPSTSAEEL